jgi:hypothetical protein
MHTTQCRAFEKHLWATWPCNHQNCLVGQSLRGNMLWSICFRRQDTSASEEYQRALEIMCSSLTQDTPQTLGKNNFQPKFNKESMNFSHMLAASKIAIFSGPCKYLVLPPDGDKTSIPCTSQINVCKFIFYHLWNCLHCICLVYICSFIVK